MAEKKISKDNTEAAVQSALDEQVKIREEEGRKADEARERQEKAAQEAIVVERKDDAK